MKAVILAGAACATFSAVVLGLIQIARWAKWRQKPNWTPTLTWAAIAFFIWKEGTL